MKLYAEVGSSRARQVVGDAAVVLWVAGWIAVALVVADRAARLAGPGEAARRAGVDFARSFEAAGRGLSEIPVAGESLAAPLDAAAAASAALARAGSAQAEAARALALWIGWGFAVLPVSLMLLGYLPGRLRWVREATAAERIRLTSADLELLARRAVATQPLSKLLRAAPDPMAALANGDYEPLAALELRALGLRPVGERARNGHRA
jgi:hypothetical protein